LLPRILKLLVDLLQKIIGWIPINWWIWPSYRWYWWWLKCFLEGKRILLGNWGERIWLVYWCGVWNIKSVILGIIISIVWWNIECVVLRKGKSIVLGFERDIWGIAECVVWGSVECVIWGIAECVVWGSVEIVREIGYISCRFKLEVSGSWWRGWKWRLISCWIFMELIMHSVHWNWRQLYWLNVSIIYSILIEILVIGSFVCRLRKILSLWSYLWLTHKSHWNCYIWTIFNFQIVWNLGFNSSIDYFLIGWFRRVNLIWRNWSVNLRLRDNDLLRLRNKFIYVALLILLSWILINNNWLPNLLNRSILNVLNLEENVLMVEFF